MFIHADLFFCPYFLKFISLFGKVILYLYIKQNKKIMDLQKGLSMDQLQEIVPAAFCEKPSQRLSDKYSFIPTSRVINDLMTMGFVPFKAFQLRKRKGIITTAKHQIHFKREDLITSDKEFLEVILTNSHDGSSTFNLQIGVFVLVCSNGLVVPKEMFGSVNVKHIGYSYSELETSLNDLFKYVPQVMEKIDTMKKKELSDDEKIKFAMEACKARWDKEVKISVEELLKPIREENKSNDLWNVFNVVQEKLIKGTQETKINNRSVRAIRNLNHSNLVNKRLFEVACSFV